MFATNHVLLFGRTTTERLAYTDPSHPLYEYRAPLLNVPRYFAAPSHAFDTRDRQERGIRCGRRFDGHVFRAPMPHRRVPSIRVHDEHAAEAFGGVGRRERYSRAGAKEGEQSVVGEQCARAIVRGLGKSCGMFSCIVDCCWLLNVLGVLCV